METLCKIRESINFLVSAITEDSSSNQSKVNEWMRYLEVLAWEVNMESGEDDLSDVEFPKGYFKGFTPEAKMFLITSAIRGLQRVINKQEELVNG